MKKIATVATLLSLLQAANSCQINEDFRGDLTASQIAGSTANATSLLAGTYISLRAPFQNVAYVLSLTELPTDELILPTRGPDWDDNGVWRQLHLQQWDPDNIRIRDTFNLLNGTVFAATDLLQYNPTTQQQAEARFLRAWAMYWILDLYDQVPYRDPGESVIQPARVRKGLDALSYIISEISAVRANLPTGPAGLANQDAARAVLMKCYLNKGVYANRAAPTFDAADMNQVISLADEIINGNRYSFTTNYFDNFAPNNTAIGRENIFTQENVGGSSSGLLRTNWTRAMHYNQNPTGNNGSATPAAFYDKFEASDKRRGVAYTTTGGPANPGRRINVGFLLGQQYNLTTDAPLNDRSGVPLVFTRDAKLIETGSDLERTGIRSLKYAVDYVNDGNRLVNNDWVYLRLPDVLLMKAEAILRGGTATSAGTYGSTPLALVNAIRTNASRGASALTTVDLNALLDERGRELYLEGWRRQDMIRFGKFLQPYSEKAQTSSPTYLIYPIPNQQLAVNVNYTQNPGY